MTSIDKKLLVATLKCARNMLKAGCRFADHAGADSLVVAVIGAAVCAADDAIVLAERDTTGDWPK